MNKAWWIGALAAVVPRAALAAADAPKDEPREEAMLEAQQDGPRVRPVADDEDLLGRYHEVRDGMNEQLESGQGTVHIYRLIEEMADEAAADIEELDTNKISPTALRGVSLSRNLSLQLRSLIEANLLSAITTNTDLIVKRCVACSSLRSRVEDGDWVVTLGITEQMALQREAERLAVQSFLDVHFAYFPGADIVVMQLEMIRASDGAVLWAESYRSDATTAAILRTGDRLLSRSERVAELERKLEGRPYYGYHVYGGTAFIPYDGPSGGMGGASLGVRLYEHFGEDRRFLFGIGAEMFGNFGKDAQLFGAFIAGTFYYEVLSPNLNRFVVRTGPSLGGFFAGQEGNSFFAEWGAEIIFQFRLGAGVSLFYFVPTEFAGADLGGLGYKARLSFNW